MLVGGTTCLVEWDGPNECTTGPIQCDALVVVAGGLCLISTSQRNTRLPADLHIMQVDR